MKILREYRLGKKLQRLLKRFWEGQTMVPRSKGCYGRPFKMYRGLTQGSPLSPTILNIVINAVVKAKLMGVCIPQEDHNELR